MTRLRTVILTLTVLAVVLSACSSSSSTGASALIDESPGSLCVPNSQNGPVQYGLTTLNTAQFSEETTIDAVELVNADGITVAGAWVLPLDVWENDVVTGAEIAVGEFDEYPKISTTTPVRIEPNSMLGLVVALDADDAGGSVEHIRVQHHSDGRSFHADSSNQITVAAIGEACID